MSIVAWFIVALIALWFLWPREWHKRSTVKRRRKGKARSRGHTSRNSRSSLKRKPHTARRR
jgi:ABC-type nickel/cobalt efflux system permease component RcnA